MSEAISHININDKFKSPFVASVTDVRTIAQNNSKQQQQHENHPALNLTELCIVSRSQMHLGKTPSISFIFTRISIDPAAIEQL